MQLTQKDQTFKWETRYQKAFQDIKTLFTDESTLQSYNPKKKLTVEILREKNILQDYNLQKKQTIEINTLQ